MPPARRVASVVASRSLPLRTRLGLVEAEVRRRAATREAYRVPYASADLYLTHDDYEVDWETFKSVLVDRIYEVDCRDAVVLDIGAHKGYFGAWALARGARHVVSYEPEAVNATFVRRSIATSMHARWELEEVAVGSAAGEAELQLMEGSWGHALEPPDEWSVYAVGTQRVPVVAFADALARATAGTDGSRVVVKTNIEGGECDLVRGTPVETWRAVDEVVVATHPWAACSEGDLERHLVEAGLTPSPSGHPRMLRLRREERPRSDRRTATR
jgi:FkbM family methyltransferase